MTLFTPEKRSDTISLLQGFGIVSAQTGVSVGDVLASFRFLEDDANTNPEGLFRVDGLIASEACFLQVMAVQAGTGGEVVVTTRKVAETLGYFDADGIFASSSALSFKAVELGNAGAEGRVQQAITVSPGGTLGVRIAELIIGIDAPPVATVVPAGGEGGGSPPSLTPGMVAPVPVIAVLPVPAVAVPGFGLSLDGVLVPCPGKGKGQLVWIRDTTFARRVMVPERFTSLTGQLIMEWSGKLWCDALRSRKVAGPAACMGPWVTLGLASAVQSLAIATDTSALERLAQGEVDVDYKQLSLAHFRYAASSPGVGGELLPSTAPVATTVQDLRELETWLSNLEIVLAYLCGPHFFGALGEARALLFPADNNPLTQTTPTYLREQLEQQLRTWTFSVRTLKGVVGVNLMDCCDVAKWLGRLMLAALDVSTFSVFPHSMWNCSPLGYGMLQNTDYGASPPSSASLKRKITATNADSEEDEEGAPCAFKLFELAGIKRASGKVVRCVRKGPGGGPCHFCKFRPLKTLASVTLKEARRVVDKYRRSKDPDEKDIGGRMHQAMSTITWKK
jgi:hypothetical protein